MKNFDPGVALNVSSVVVALDFNARRARPAFLKVMHTVLINKRLQLLLCTKCGNKDETVGATFTIVEKRHRTDDRASVLEKGYLQ